MDFLQGLTTAILVLLVLTGTVVILRNRGLARFEIGRRAAPRRLETVERLALTPHHALHLVRFEDKMLIVASAPGGCNILGPVDVAVKATQ